MRRQLYIAILSALLLPLAAHANNNADQSFQSGDWQAAEKAYQEITSTGSATPSDWYRLGRSLLEQKKYKQAAAPLEKALASQDAAVLIPTHISLARVHAATDESELMLRQLQLIAEAGATPYLAIRNAEEFTAYTDLPEFENAVATLQPCGADEYRAFDFWLGTWTVTSPVRPGWIADSSITRGNDGCSIHEWYRSPGGYEGRSINFYDRQLQKWNQTWIDNQGGPLYLQGGLNNEGQMVLSNENSRIIWSALEDGRVRQHWQAKGDDETWTTVFDGYYAPKAMAQAEGTFSQEELSVAEFWENMGPTLRDKGLEPYLKRYHPEFRSWAITSSGGLIGHDIVTKAWGNYQKAGHVVTCTNVIPVTIDIVGDRAYARLEYEQTDDWADDRPTTTSVYRINDVLIRNGNSWQLLENNMVDITDKIEDISRYECVRE